MGHTINLKADSVLDIKFKVLDHGFITLVDYLGGDKRIAEAAWVSSIDEVETEKKTPGAIKRIINYMLKNSHTSPFEQVVLTFRCKMPIFVARQWVRHRTARLNEMSGRYRILPAQAYVPSEERLGGKGVFNKQGTEGSLNQEEIAKQITSTMKTRQEDLYEDYAWYDSQGLANELCRINLPLAQYTEWYWQIDLHNLFHFLKLRLHPHAQWEIQQYAKVMLDLARKVAPLAIEAFEEYQLHAVKFSYREMKALVEILQTADTYPGVNVLSSDWYKHLPRQREQEDFLVKLGLAKVSE